jgi:hypothetical protein
MITVDDPKEFRQVANREKVRKHAMRWYRGAQRDEAAAADASVVESVSHEYDSVEMSSTPPYGNVGQVEQYLPLSLPDIAALHFDTAIVQSNFHSLSYGIPHDESFDHTPTSRVTGYKAHNGYEHTMVQMLLDDYAINHYQPVDGDVKAARDILLPTYHPPSAEYLLKLRKSHISVLP